jgi:hypothetical protein
MTTAGDLCERGFLPRELPPPFSSASFGAVVRSGWVPTATRISRSAPHNLFRWGTLRRQLSIPNPIAFASLCREIEMNWQLLQPVLALSPWSLSRPVVAKERAVERQREQKVVLLARAAARAGNRYAVRADISRFYHSIYTHTLEWAVHTKAAAKSNRALPHSKRQPLWGRGLDDRHRDLQDGQSVGIPVGPDTSLIASEILLARVDELAARHVRCHGFRYVDDYELCFPDLGSAERALTALQTALAEYELALNPSKTYIVELPSPLEPEWARTLRRISLRRTGSGQRLDFVDMFDAAFQFRANVPDTHVLRFTMGRVRRVTCLKQNWPLLQSLLLQAMAVEPGVIREVLSELVRYGALGRPLDTPRIAETLEGVVLSQAPLAHGSEVAWALWAHIQLGIRLSDRELDAAETMTDSVVALVALDAEQRKLTPRAIASTAWASMMSLDELNDTGWLLAYEAAAKGWLSNAHLSQDVDFSALASRKVEFYRVLHTPATAAINLSGSAGVGGGEDVSG